MFWGYTDLVFFFFVPLLSVFFDLELDFFGTGCSAGSPANNTNDLLTIAKEKINEK